MKFSVAAVLAFAAAALAKPVLLNSNYQLVEDTPFTLKWNNAQGPVTITLMTGADKNNLKKVTDLATGVTDNEYTITLTDLPSGTYAIRITDSTADPNYSPQFQYVGTGTLPSSSSSASSSVTRTSSASATSTTSSSSSSSETETESSSTSSSASSTSSSFTTTTTSSPSTTRASTQTTTPVNSNNGQRFASPLAFVLVTVAALVFFN